MWKLMGGLLALPVLLVLSALMIFWGSGDYVRTGSAGRSGGPAARFFGLPRLHGGAPNG